MDLLAKNLILEVGARSEVRRGKPAMLLEFNEGLYQLIGIDLSDSTMFRGAVVDLRGAVLHHREVEINGSQGEEALGKLIQLVKSLSGELTAPLLGLGVGVPGVVSTEGVVLNAPILGWHDLDLRSMLQEVFDCPVVLGNDANVAAFAEYTYGGGAEDMILIRIGVGVSMGILLDGKPLLGSRSAAGEIRHITVGIESDRVCGCGRTGCLETWLSTRNLFKDLAAAKDETEHAAVITTAGQALGATLAPIVAALNTSEIVLSGPTQIVEGLFSATVSQSICDRTLTSRSGDVALRLSTLGDDVVLRGATALVMSNELGIT